MQTNRIIGALLYALALSACNDASHTGDEAADAASRTALASRKEAPATLAALPEAVPVQFTLTSLLVPVNRSNKKMSGRPLLSSSTRSLAELR